MMDKVKPNLWFFYIGLLLLVGAAVWFAVHLLTPDVVVGNEELLIGGVMAIVGAAFGYAGGYAAGSMQALTAPAGGPDMMTETTALALAQLASGQAQKDDDPDE